MFKHLSVGTISSREAFVPSPGRSALFNELSELCQSVFDQLPKDINTRNKYDALDESHKAMESAGFSKRLVEITKKHLNLRLTKVNIWEATFLNAAMGFGLDIPKGNNPSQIFITGLPQYSVANIYQYLSQMSTTQNDNGSLDPLPDLHTLIVADFYFVPSWWIVPVLHPGHSVSADSIAAIILHELGHALNFYRDFGRLRKYNDIVSDIVPNVRNATTRKDYEDVYKVLCSITEGLEAKLKDADKLGLTKIDVKNIKDDIGTQKYLTDNYKALLDKTPDTDINTSKELGAAMYFVTVLFVDIAISLNGWFSYPNTELLKTDTQYTHEERLADEFAVRNGAGSALSAGINLLITLGEGSKNPNSLLRKIPLIKQMAELMDYLSVVTDVSATAVTSTYDPPVERLRQIMKSAMGAIKDKSLSQDARDFYVEQIKESQAIFDAYANKDTTKARAKFAQLVEAAFSLPFTPLLVMLKRTGMQYKCLQDWTDNLIRNELAYHSARIDKLTR